ncbi:MAG: membrane protein insertion efficiency factor YidD [Desulfurobacteriaceae bacterium]
MKGAVLFMIKLYQRFVSPLFPGSCRYHPTCSSYAILAIEKYGLLRGGVKSLWRILRCNPLSKGGIDYP